MLSLGALLALFSIFLWAAVLLVFTLKMADILKSLLN